MRCLPGAGAIALLHMAFAFRAGEAHGLCFHRNKERRLILIMG